MDSIWQQLQQWYQQPLGNALSELVQAQVDLILPKVFGYHLLQIGAMSKAVSFAGSPISHRVALLPSPPPETDFSLVYGHYNALPFQSDSLDLVFIAHALEFDSEPKHLLEEVWRILIAEGCLMILCFNPYSLWGLRRWFTLYRQDSVPWSGRFLSYSVLHRWLRELHCEVIHSQRCFFRPPLKQAKYLKELAILETMGQRFWSFGGAVSFIVAKKKVVTLTPLKPNWETESVMVAKGLEPTTRSSSP